LEFNFGTRDARKSIKGSKTRIVA